jgi:hypothetical protein
LLLEKWTLFSNALKIATSRVTYKATLHTFAECFRQKIPKKVLKKKILEKCFPNYLCLRPSTSNLESACKKFGGLGPLVWEEIDTEQTVVKGLAKLLYKCLKS